MLLRSASTPLLQSNLPYCKLEYYSSSPSPSQERESINLQLPKSRSSSTLHSMASSFSSSSPSSFDDSITNKMSRTLSDSYLKELIMKPRRCLAKNITSTSKSRCMAMHGLFQAVTVNEEEDDDDQDEMEEKEEDVEVEPTVQVLSGAKRLDLLRPEERREAGASGAAGRLAAEVPTVVGGGSSGSGGGKTCRGGGSSSDGGDGDSDGSGYSDTGHRHENTDVYYQKMIEANPTNYLLLTNYARYLKEVSS